MRAHFQESFLCAFCQIFGDASAMLGSAAILSKVELLRAASKGFAVNMSDEDLREINEMRGQVTPCMVCCATGQITGLRKTAAWASRTADAMQPKLTALEAVSVFFLRPLAQTKFCQNSMKLKSQKTETAQMRARAQSAVVAITGCLYSALSCGCVQEG